MDSSLQNLRWAVFDLAHCLPKLQAAAERARVALRTSWPDPAEFPGAVDDWKGYCEHLAAERPPDADPDEYRPCEDEFYRGRRLGWPELLDTLAAQTKDTLRKYHAARDALAALAHAQVAELGRDPDTLRPWPVHVKLLLAAAAEPVLRLQTPADAGPIPEMGSILLAIDRGDWPNWREGLIAELANVALTLDAMEEGDDRKTTRQPTAPVAADDLEPEQRGGTNYPTPDNRERDKWVYEQVKAGRKHADIIGELEEQAADWELLSSPSGIREAAKRYAKHHGLPSPRGKPGRRKETY